MNHFPQVLHVHCPVIVILEKKQKIVLRELSFDEHAEVAGTELLAPVFLAIAEENDEDSEFQGMRKKAQSIEDLCAVIDEDGNLELPFLAHLHCNFESLSKTVRCY